MQAAVIDIGSNSIRYMEANITPQGVFCLCKQLKTTRLASNIADTGYLSQQSMEKSLEAIKFFSDIAQQKQIPCYAYATSAVRDAKNREEFLEMVYKYCSLNVDVLSGQQEAQFALEGIQTNVDGLIDIGGGSIQLVTSICRESRPVGCVRMKDYFSDLNPSQTQNAVFALQHAQQWPQLQCIRWAGVGGTITTLAALAADLHSYDAQIVSRTILHPSLLADLIQKLIEMGNARQYHPLLLNRHDTILYGAYSLQYLMKHLQIQQIVASDCDGMEGYLYHIFFNGDTKV